MKYKNYHIFLDSYKNNKILFFAGSGISYDSNLPSASSIIDSTLDVFLPSNINKNILNILKKIQPEVIYELLLKLSNQNIKTLELWTVLSSKNNHIEPNINHLFIVQYSYIANKPIFTTNFDTLFEQAANILKIPYEVFLPEDIPPKSFDKLAICKLHGTIEDKNGNLSLDNIYTTISSITRINSKWINFLLKIIDNNYLTFVGYSGRDIDIFPYIEKKIYGSSNQIFTFWINDFDNDLYSNNYSQKINALQISSYPKNIFTHIIKKYDKKLQFYLLNTQSNHNNHNKNKLIAVKNNLLDKNIFNIYEKELFLLILLKIRGLYKYSYKMSQEFFKSKYILLSCRMQLIFLEHFAHLHHEVSRYSSYNLLAKKILKQANIFNHINFYIKAKCFISESYRMNIPNDIYFNYKRSAKENIYILKTIISFLANLLTFKLLVFVFKNKIDLSTQFEIIEHKIRFYALLQGIVLKIFKINFFYKVLSYAWDKIKLESSYLGYAAGIANAGKFKQRLPIKNIEKEFIEANNIYHLLTSSTGEELNIRNKADMYLNQTNYNLAIKLYKNFIQRSRKSGNKLNEIKGLIALAYIENKQKQKHILSTFDKKRFFILSYEIEGLFWKRYFTNISKFFKHNNTLDDE